MVRSVNVVSTEWPFGVMARSKNGFGSKKSHVSQKVWRERTRQITIVRSQTPYSVSQNLTVESNPQLYAFFFSPLSSVLLFPVGANNTFDTLAVWDLSTGEGDFRRGLAKSSSFLFFCDNVRVHLTPALGLRQTKVLMYPISLLVHPKTKWAGESWLNWMIKKK